MTATYVIAMREVRAIYGWNGQCTGYLYGYCWRHLNGAHNSRDLVWIIAVATRSQCKVKITDRLCEELSNRTVSPIVARQMGTTRNL